MSLFLSEKDRRVIPRWRDFRTTAESGELEAQSSAEGPAVGGDKYFEQKLGAWQAVRSIETAADVVASALVLGRHSDAVDAAHFLLEPGREPTSAVRAVAEQILSPEDQVGRVVSPEPKDVDIQAEVLRLRIRAL